LELTDHGYIERKRSLRNGKAEERFTYCMIGGGFRRQGYGKETGPRGKILPRGGEDLNQRKSPHSSDAKQSHLKLF